MEKFLGQEYPPEKREQFLKDNADKLEEMGYMKQFSSEELNELKTFLADVSIKIADIEAEKKKKMDEFKERLKGPSEEKTNLVMQIKNKAEFTEELCYKFVDHEADEVAYYNKEGERVLQRGILPDERQSTIFSLNRTGTHE